jgi:outer membrane protein assembly factor BamB/orotate phosphoribosyltransferase
MKQEKTFIGKISYEEKQKKLLKIIKKGAIVYPSKELMISANSFNQTRWVLDIRKIILNSKALDLVADIFWDIFEKNYPFQVGGQELSAIPLISAIVLKGNERNKEINGFIIRKSRKKHDLQRIIEGTLTKDKVILVDDLINSGTTLSRGLRILQQAEGLEIFAVFALVRFQEEINLDLLGLDKAKKIVTLFSLKKDLDLKRSLLNSPKEDFEVLWYFKSKHPLLSYDVSKSSPIIDKKKLYFGSDDRKFWALYQKDGTVAWKFDVGHSAGGKSIFSSPIIWEDKVYFGSYDGNFYALNKETGKLVWEYKEADFISSSPCIATKHSLLFVGLEFGLKNKKGGIVALNLETGIKKWEFSMTDFVSASPTYADFCETVFIGSNEGCLFSFNAVTGKPNWRFKAKAEIKGTPAFSAKHKLVIVGSFDKNVYFLDIDTGVPKFIVKTQDLVFSTPLVKDDFVFIASSDKSLYKFDLKKGELEWRVPLAGRIFSSPTLIEGNIFIGCNDGFMYEIDSENGVVISFFSAIERLTNNVIYASAEKKFFISTYANEIYCLRRKNSKKTLENSTMNSMKNAWEKFANYKDFYDI